MRDEVDFSGAGLVQLGTGAREKSKLSPGDGCGDGRKGQILGFGI
jgi:hypothetical protein